MLNPTLHRYTSSLRIPKRSEPNFSACARHASTTHGQRVEKLQPRGGAVGGVFLPAYRTERPLQHAADADRIGSEMEIDRALVQRLLELPAAPLWLEQVHGTAVQRFTAPADAGAAEPEADAAVAGEHLGQPPGPLLRRAVG